MNVETVKFLTTFAAAITPAILFWIGGWDGGRNPTTALVGAITLVATIYTYFHDHWDTWQQICSLSSKLADVEMDNLELQIKLRNLEAKHGNGEE